MSHPVKLPTPPRRWVARGEAADGAVAGLVRSLRLPEPLCRLLVVRGFVDEASAKRYLRPRMEQLHDPFGLAGMEAAVARLERALDRGETILVHGDYDVDGICAAALYTRTIRALGGRAEVFIPHRLTDGYDLGPAGIQRAKEVGAGLILTGDCGILAHDAVAAAAAAGIDVVVTDHHTPGESLPPAMAVVNPHRPDCTYPERKLAGAGVAFKVCQALYAARGVDPEPLWYDLDLVALATVADLVPLDGENRVLVRYGLRVLAQTRNPGLMALLERSGLAQRPGQEVTAGQVGHVLAPRLNAIGRMGEALLGVRLLLTESEPEARSIAERLEVQNRIRQQVEQQIVADALGQLERGYDPAHDYGVVLAAETWHPGVIGIVASRVVERIHRPTVLVALDAKAGRGRGSARSIPGFDLYRALEECADELERFGGHRAAAGLEIRPDRIDAFRDAFNARAKATLSPEQLAARVEIDLELPLRAANRELYDMLRHFGPFGVGNPTPVFVARGVEVGGEARVVGDGHLRFELVQDGARLGAIGFRMADRLGEVARGRGPLDVAFQLTENHWNGRTTLQARLVDLRRAE